MHPQVIPGGYRHNINVFIKERGFLARGVLFFHIYGCP